MTHLDFYWRTNKDWYMKDETGVLDTIKPDAPKEAQESYKHYLEQLETKKDVI